MLHLDILQLKQFYASNLGRNVTRFVSQAIDRLWPYAGNLYSNIANAQNVHNSHNSHNSQSSQNSQNSQKNNYSFLVVGYGVPYIEPYLKQSAQLMLAMPANQGAAAWPNSSPNRVLLVNEADLPLQNNSIDRVLLVHSIEYSEQLNALMQEVWRVLTPGGKVLAIVPNRVSFWSGSTKTPFGFGRPFNVLQLRSLFITHHFTILRTASALFSPPFVTQISTLLSAKIERIGRLLWWFLGGVIILEAEKQLYASIKEPVFVGNKYAVALRSRQTATVSGKSSSKTQNDYN